MSLKEWSIPTTSFDLPGGGDIAVRGLSVEQVVALVREDRDTLTSAFEAFTARDDIAAAAKAMAEGEPAPEIDEDIAVGDVASGLLETAPRLVAKIIAWAAGEHDAVEQAARLPFPLQLDILIEVGRLTFETTSPKKFMETVITLLGSANRSMAMAKAARSASTTGSGG